MNICRNCGVELAEDMETCPLCGTYVSADNVSKGENSQPAKPYFLFTKEKQEKHSLQKVLWQVSTIILFSGIIATLIIDLALNNRITWSVYPVTISLIVFSYLSLFAFWHTRIIFQLLGGWLIATILLLGIDIIVDQTRWPTLLAIPLLFAVNLITIGFIIIAGFTPRKGLNLIACAFVAIALLCLSIETIISLYTLQRILLEWSVIVAACLLPVTAALLFMYWRTRKNAHLQKIFHT
jgi:hypothetical protein